VVRNALPGGGNCQKNRRAESGDSERTPVVVRRCGEARMVGPARQVVVPEEEAPNAMRWCVRGVAAGRTQGPDAHLPACKRVRTSAPALRSATLSAGRWVCHAVGRGGKRV